MTYKIYKKILLLFSVVIISIALLTACGQNEAAVKNNNNVSNGTSTVNSAGEVQPSEHPIATELVVRFGDNGAPFILHLEDNETAKAIAEYAGTTDWRLPIYHYDDYENYEVMQYYELPSRYRLPSHPQTVTSEGAGEVYYSEENQIVLFYHDAEISGEYTKIGQFDVTEEFVSAVENNPVLEGWGNKIILIQSAH